MDFSKLSQKAMAKVRKDEIIEKKLRSIRLKLDLKMAMFR
jgi:hypothetical protein